MKKIVAAIFILFLFNAVLSQEPTFEWSKKWVYATQGTDVDLDSDGNVYLVSYGGETTNFNLSNGPSILGPTFGCAAVTKLDPSGNVIWIKFIEVNAPTSGGIRPTNVVVKNGFIYVTGLFGGGGGTYDFDPGIGSATSGGQNPNSKGFVFKWDIDGNYVWHKTIETSISWPAISVNDLYVDINDNVFICGSFTQTIISDGISVVSVGGGDCYFLKLDSSGNTLIFKSFGGVDSASPDEVWGICGDSSGNIYLTGSFNLSVDFDPGIGQTILGTSGSSDVFVSKLNFQGDLLWVHTFGSNNLADFGSDIVLDENENIVFTGITMGVIDFDMSASVNLLNSNSGYAYVAKWNPNGNFIWAKGLYSDQQSQGLQLSVFNSQVILAGICSGITDFDPSQGVFNLSNSGSLWSSFLLRLDGSGNYTWAGLLDNLDGNWSKPSGVAQSVNSILFCGWFQGTMDSNPIINQSNILNSLTNNAGVPSPSNFVIKLGQCLPTTSTQNVSACGTYNWPENNQTYFASGEYSSILINSNGCDSIIVLNLTLTESVVETCDGVDNDCDTFIDEGCATQASFNIAPTGCSGSIVIPNNTSVLDTTCQDIHYIWYVQPNMPGTQFVNSTDSSSFNPEIQLVEPGLYTIVLSVNSCGVITYASQQIQITPATNYFLDTDLDGYGGSQVISSCVQEVGYVTNSLDCDDSNALIYPGAPEVLDSLDNNCDGQIDEGLSPDADGDGFTVADGDCDDTNASVNPNATELCNGIDDNCNTQVDEGFDLDADTFTICNGDCDDTNALIYPGAPEVLDSVDNNCDGQIDEGLNPDPDADGDGFSLSEGDCNDADPNVNPGATELCNGIDDNCNSMIDEGFDLDGDGETSCEGDCNDNDSLVNTSAIELCNSIDDNCDTFINEGLACDEVTIQIPNGISPNGDGFNDAWYLPWLNGMTDYSIVISNRWGQVIFQANDYSTPWDGTYLGNSLPAADYFYVIKLSDNTIYEGVISIKY